MSWAPSYLKPQKALLQVWLLSILLSIVDTNSLIQQHFILENETCVKSTEDKFQVDNIFKHSKYIALRQQSSAWQHVS